MSYHVNPETGRPNLCTATLRDCKFAVNGELPEHYETKQEAKQAAEKLMNNKHGITNTLTKKKNHRITSSNNDLSDSGVFAPDFSNMVPDEVLKNEYRRRLLNVEYDKDELEQIEFSKGTIYDLPVETFFINGNATMTMNKDSYENEVTFTKSQCGMLALELSKQSGFNIAQWKTPNSKYSGYHYALCITDGKYLDIDNDISDEKGILSKFKSHSFNKPVIKTRDEFLKDSNITDKSLVDLSDKLAIHLTAKIANEILRENNLIK